MNALKPTHGAGLVRRRRSIRRRCRTTCAQKLGWLLLDYLRVCSIGARLPWSEWARSYVALVGKAGASHALFSPTCSIRSTRLSSTSPMVRASMPTTPMSARCCIRAWRPGRRRWRSPSIPVRPDPSDRRGSGRLRDDHPHRACGAAQPFQARLPEHRHLRRLRHGGRRRATVVSRRATPSGASPRRSGLPAAMPAGSRSSITPARRPSASRRRTRRNAASRRRCSPQQGFGGPTDIIEGTGGFARAYADGWNPEVIESGLGARFHLMDVLVKSHAAAARVAAGIDGMLALRRAHGFSADDIAACSSAFRASSRGG